MTASRLSQAVSLIAAEHVTCGDGFDEAISEMARLPFTCLERFCDRLDHLRSDENVPQQSELEPSKVAV